MSASFRGDQRIFLLVCTFDVCTELIQWSNTRSTCATQIIDICGIAVRSMTDLSRHSWGTGNIETFATRSISSAACSQFAYVCGQSDRRTPGPNSSIHHSATKWIVFVCLCCSMCWANCNYRRLVVIEIAARRTLSRTHRQIATLLCANRMNANKNFRTCRRRLCVVVSGVFTRPTFRDHRPPAFGLGEIHWKRCCWLARLSSVRFFALCILHISRWWLCNYRAVRRNDARLRPFSNALL